MQINLTGTKLMRRVAWTEKQVEELGTKDDNWKMQFESLWLEKEELAKEKEVLEQQLKMTTVELAVAKIEANQVEKENTKMETNFTEQHCMSAEKIRSLKELLNQKEIYTGELVQEFNQTKEELHVSSERITFLESSLKPLKVSYDGAEVEKENLQADVDQ